MAKTPAQRKAEQRERDALAENERLARLLARTIRLDLYHATNDKLVAIMERIGVDEPQDAISRLIHGCAKLDDETLASLTDLK